MTGIDFICLSPLIIIAIAPVIMMLGITFARNFRVTYLFSLLMFIVAFLSLFAVAPYTTYRFEPLLVIDNYAVLFLGIIYFAAIVITVLSYEYLKVQYGDREEYFIILFVAVLGASVLIMAEHFITFFLGLEVLSVALYSLIAYLKWRDYCVEAGVKFAVIASLATAFLLFGMGLVYSETGTMSFPDIFSAERGVNMMSPLMLTGFGLILTAIGFKLALVPFHMWTPDVYQGAPVPVTLFIATVSKAAVMALALRLFVNIGGADNRILFIVISVISIVSMFTGNILALMQKNVKRLLAYSSIAHLGYLTITLLSPSTGGTGAAIFYLAAYVITSLGAFGAISVLSVCERDADDIEDLRGLFWSNPLIATVLTLAFLSLAGMPLTAGFMSKFYLVLAGVKSGLWLLAVSLVINSVISIYYYLRVIRIMFSQTVVRPGFKMTLRVHIILILIITGILLIGIVPSLLTGLISSFSSIN